MKKFQLLTVSMVILRAFLSLLFPKLELPIPLLNWKNKSFNLENFLCQSIKYLTIEDVEDAIIHKLCNVQHIRSPH